MTLVTALIFIDMAYSGMSVTKMPPKQQHLAAVAIGRDRDAELLVALELERIGAGDAELKAAVALGHREVDRDEVCGLILGRGVDAILVPVELGAELGRLGEDGRRACR